MNPIFLKFDVFCDDPRDRREVCLNVVEVSSVVQAEDRLAYGGRQPVTRVAMRNGDKFVLEGHVGDKIVEALK